MLSDELFDRYRETHGKDCLAEDSGVVFFDELYKHFYARILDQISKEADILDIGCNAGYFLKNLINRGFKSVHGVDLSPIDVSKCNELCGADTAIVANSMDYLREREGKYDVIYSRAVMEHIKKDDLDRFVVSIYKGLKSEGVALIEVPNMDWVWASHERYMDLTHEVGFTRESLEQLMRLYFKHVEIIYVDPIAPKKSMRIKLSRILMSRLLYWQYPIIEPDCFYSRCIMAICHK